METSYLFCTCIGLSTLGAMSVAEVHRHGGNDVCYTANLQWDSIEANTFTLLALKMQYIPVRLPR